MCECECVRLLVRFSFFILDFLLFLFLFLFFLIIITYFFIFCYLIAFFVFSIIFSYALFLSSMFQLRVLSGLQNVQLFIRYKSHFISGSKFLLELPWSVLEFWVFWRLLHASQLGRCLCWGGIVGGFCVFFVSVLRVF